MVARDGINGQPRHAALLGRLSDYYLLTILSEQCGLLVRLAVLWRACEAANLMSVKECPLNVQPEARDVRLKPVAAPIVSAFAVSRVEKLTEVPSRLKCRTVIERTVCCLIGRA